MGVRMDGSGNNVSFLSSILFCFGRVLYSLGVVCEALLHCMTRPTGSALHRIHYLLCTAWLGASTIAYSHTES
jgi:hypothetical protein